MNSSQKVLDQRQEVCRIPAAVGSHADAVTAWAETRFDRCRAFTFSGVEDLDGSHVFSRETGNCVIWVALVGGEYILSMPYFY